MAAQTPSEIWCGLGDVLPSGADAVAVRVAIVELPEYEPSVVDLSAVEIAGVELPEAWKALSNLPFAVTGMSTVTPDNETNFSRCPQLQS